LNAEPQALLVGFAATPEAQWPICIEPEYRFFRPAHLDGVLDRALEIYESDPRSAMSYSDRRSEERIHGQLHEQSRAKAVVEALEREAPDQVTYFAGESTPVGDYQVHPVLGIPAGALAGVPQLRTFERDRVRVARSLVHAAVELILQRASAALYDPDAGEMLGVLGATSEELGRRAATKLVGGAVWLTGNHAGELLFARLTAVSTTRYEGESGFGSVIAAAVGDQDISVDVRLRSPIALSNTRAARKLLEISDRDRVGLLTDGSEIYGLGHVEHAYDPADERIFQFRVTGDGKWLMRCGDTVLLDVEFGRPRLPRPRIDRGRFLDTATRLFRDGADADRLWQLALAAADQAHGTMLVVSETASEEAVRLSAQGIPIHEAALSPELLHQATGIDGAVLLAPDGTCHALGVILDGEASVGGDRARGARFNSAVRYLGSAAAATMIVLVSEDGMIDVLPALHPRISPATVNEAIDRYRRLTSAQRVDGELRADAYDRLRELAFYLSKAQCDLINGLEADYQARRVAGGGIAIRQRPLEPDPGLDDSYFI
jgi:hypothetical protein